MTTEQVKDFFLGKYLNVGRMLETERERWESNYIHNVVFDGTTLILKPYLEDDLSVPKSKIKALMKDGNYVSNKTKRLSYSVSQKPHWKVSPSWVDDIQENYAY